MKRIALLVLLALATTDVALADRKEGDKQQARYNALVAKMAARGSKQKAAQPQVQRSVPNRRAQSNLGQNQGRRNRTFSPRGEAQRAFTPSSPVVAPVNVPQGEISRNSRIGNKGRNRRGRGDFSRNNWSGNNNVVGNNNETGNWRNNDNDGNEGRNWRNRDGNDRNWSNRGENWRRRHSHWDRRHHNRSYWRSNFTRFALFGGGYYYFNRGYWYPAYGYDPYFSNYTYDAPIYGYNDQDPGEVIASVQGELERRGYGTGGVDGTYGPMTRRALLRYQSDNGLPATGEIDEETLNALGLQ